MKWELVFQSQAAEFASSRRGIASRRLRALLEKIAEFPLVEPTETCRGASGRLHNVQHTPEFAVVYWVDFVVKEVWIVEIHLR